MYKNIVAVVAVFFLAVSVQAGVMTFTKSNVDFEKLIAELEADTGLQFQADCATCTVHGFVSYRRDQIKVVVYESTHPTIARITAATFDAALQTQITTTVTNHTP